MTHRVNAAALRIGKSLHWHSLGSPLFRWRDLKINLFLNYFLARFLEKETYRLVRYGVRSEAKVFKIAIVAFRATTTLIGRPKGTLKSPFETYWKNHHVYKYYFRLGIVKYILQGIEDRIDHPFDDAVGIIHVDNYKKFFSIGPKWNWKRTEIFFTDGMNVDQNELGEVTPWGVVGFSAPFFVRIAAKLMVLRYAIRKSLLRTIRRRFFPSFPKVFMRVRTRTLNFLDFENRFIAGSSTSSSDWKNMLLAALFFKVGDKRGLKKHFRAFGDNLKVLIKKRVRSKKFTLLSALRKKKFLKIKKNIFCLKKNLLSGGVVDLNGFLELKKGDHSVGVAIIWRDFLKD